MTTVPFVSRAARFEILEGRTLLSGGPTLGNELVLPGDTTPDLSVGTQTNAKLAEGPNGVSLAVWQDTRSGGHPAQYFGTGLGTMTDIYAARVRADGSVVDVTPIPIAIASYNQGNAAASWNGENWLVVWSTERSDDFYTNNIHAVRLSPDGTVLDAMPRVIGTSIKQPNASDLIDPEGPVFVQSDGTDWVVGYRRGNPALQGGLGMEYFAAKVLADGTVPNQDGTRYLLGNTYYQDLGLTFSPVNGGEYLHAFDNGSGDLTLRRFDLNLQQIPGSTRVIAGQDISSRAVGGGSDAGWMIAWEDPMFGGGVKAVRINASGNIVDTSPLVVYQTNTSPDISLDVVWNGIDWTIAYSAYSSTGGSDHDVYFRHVDATAPGAAALKGAAKIVGGDGHQNEPALVSSGDGGSKMTFNDTTSATPGVSVAIATPADALQARAIVSLAAPSQTEAELASDGINFLLVFNSRTAFGTRMLAQRVAPDGSAIDAEPMLIAEAAWAPNVYEVVYLQGRYVVFFNANTGPEGKQIYARTVSATTGEVSAAVAVMPNAPFTGFSLSDATVLDDRILLSGASGEGSLHNSRLFARVFDADLQPVSPRFQISAGIAGATTATAVGDRWLVAYAWKSSHNAPRSGIGYNFVTYDGVALNGAAGETLVSSNPDNGGPAVVSNGNEAATEAMIIWPRSVNVLNPEFANENAIVGQRIAMDGTRIGGLKVLVDQPELQTSVRAAFDGTDYVMTWTDQRNYPYPEQPRDDIYGQRVSVDGTVLDPGGFAVANTIRPEQHGDVAVAGGRVMFAYRTFRHEAPWGSYRLAAKEFAAAPLAAAQVNSPPTFNFSAGAIELEFDHPLQNVDAEDLIITHRANGSPIAQGSVDVEFIPATDDHGWIYRWQVNAGALATGHYRVRLPANAVVDLSGRPIANDVVGEFAFVNADANLDRHVDGLDAAILTAHLGQPGDFSLGDFNFDGTVNAADQTILQDNMNVWLPDPGDVALPATRGDDAYRLQSASSTMMNIYVGQDVNPTYRVPMADVASYSFAAGRGADSIALIGTSAADTFSFAASGAALNGLPIYYTDVETIAFDGAGGANAASLAAGAHVQTIGFQKLTSLSIAADAKLEVGDNDLLITDTPKQTVESYITSAHNFGDWNGQGGIFSAAARDNPSASTTLGLLTGQEFNDNNGGAFNGVAVNNADVLIKYTYFGDVDFNGQVDVSDYNLIDFGYSNQLTGWGYGDADYSGGVDASDYNVIDYAFATQDGVL